MQKYKLYLGVFLIFVLGMIIGFLGSAIYIRNRIQRFLQGDPSVIQVIVVRRLRNELQLTKEQQSKIEKIVEDAAIEFQQFRKKYQPEFTQIVDHKVDTIAGELHPEQKERLYALYKNIKEKWQIHVPIKKE